jgi:YfiH family protein
MFVKFQHLSKFTTIKHFVSTRKGGASLAPFEGSNLSYAVKDLPQAVAHNRELLAKSVGFSVSQLCVPQQTHSANIKIVNQQDAGQGAYNYLSGAENTDGLLTASPNLCLMVFSADCVLTLFYDKKQQIIGAVHGGWRGTMQKIAAKTSLLMQQHFDSKPENIVVGIAPAIGVCCYEVGNEVAETFGDAFAQKDNYLKMNKKTGKYHIDLHKATQEQLMTDTGILAQNIETMEICTFCNSHTFFSSRQGKGITGRFGAGIMIG